MNIKFKTIHIENFMSIGEATIDLSDRGFTLIEGMNNNVSDNARSNGSGKSSLFEALVWCLTGDTIRGNKNIVNYNGTNGALVELKFAVDNNEFTLIRTKEHSKYKNNLFIEVNGEDKSGKGIRDSQKILEEYLPDLTSSLIGSVIVLGQGLPQKFSSNSPSGRKETLEKLFKSDYMIQDLKDRLMARKKILEDELRAVQDNKLVANANLQNILTVTAKNETRLQELAMKSDLEIECDTLHKEILEIEEHITHLKDSIDCGNLKIVEFDRRKYEIDKHCTESQREVDSQYDEQLKNLQTELNKVTADVRFTKMELDRVSSITDICPTCGQHIQGVHKPDISGYQESYENAYIRSVYLTRELDTIKSGIKNKKDLLSCEANELLNAVYVEDSKVRTTLEHHRRELRTLESELIGKKQRFEETQTLKNTLHFEIESLKKMNEENEERKLQLQEDICKYSESENELEERLSVVKKFFTVTSREFRGYLLNDIIVYINSKAKEYCKDVFGNDFIEFTLDGNNLLISYGGKEYESLSGGERQKIDIIVQFAIRDMLCTHTSFSSNIIVMDEIFDNLDDVGCQMIINLIVKKLYDINSIFIITHHGNELNIPYDDMIKIEKTNEGITRLCN